MGMTRIIKLHIEELVLQGFGHGEQRRIRAAVRRELERLIREQGIQLNVKDSASIALLKAGPVQLRQGKTAATGAEIGRAIYVGLAQRPPRPGGASR
jgi:hypothetical protein